MRRKEQHGASAFSRRRLPLYLIVLLLCVAACLLQAAYASGSAGGDVPADGEKHGTEGQNGEQGAGKAEDDAAAKAAQIDKERAAEARRRLLDENADWGTFYDPKNIFCGKYDCYKILGFDHETFYMNKPSRGDITKAYRALSRAWHPDKNKRKGAKERFVKIVRAYEVLTNKEMREEYDYFRDRPDEYFEKYGSSVLWSYAPKSDARVIIVVLLVFFSWLSRFIKKQRWQQVADHITKAAMDGLGLREGGSHESMEIRKRALDIQFERQAKLKSEGGSGEGNGDGKKNKGGKKSGGAKQTGKEKKKASQEELRAIIVELVNEIDDFGGGFRKPTMWDLFVVQLVLLPWKMCKSVAWWVPYLVRRMRGIEYSDEELEYFTRKAVGEAAWDCATEEERNEMKTRELWKQQNLEDWREELETQNLSAGYQKRYRRWKKKEGTKME